MLIYQYHKHLHIRPHRAAKWNCSVMCTLLTELSHSYTGCTTTKSFQKGDNSRYFNWVRETRETTHVVSRMTGESPQTTHTTSGSCVRTFTLKVIFSGGSWGGRVWTFNPPLPFGSLKFPIFGWKKFKLVSFPSSFFFVNFRDWPSF